MFDLSQLLLVRFCFTEKIHLISTVMIFKGKMDFSCCVVQAVTRLGREQRVDRLINICISQLRIKLGYVVKSRFDWNSFFTLNVMKKT